MSFILCRPSDQDQGSAAVSDVKVNSVKVVEVLSIKIIIVAYTYTS